MTNLDKFGKFIIENLRDKAIEQHLLMQQGHWKSPRVQKLQKAIAQLSKEQKEVLLEAVVDVIDTALHDLLFAFQDAHDRKLGIEILADGENVSETSGMLNGEQLGTDGWVVRFSRFPSRGKTDKEGM